VPAASTIRAMRDGNLTDLQTRSAEVTHRILNS
jgi:hypothetical protein